MLVYIIHTFLACWRYANPSFRGACYPWGMFALRPFEQRYGNTPNALFLSKMQNFAGILKVILLLYPARKIMSSNAFSVLTRTSTSLCSALIFLSWDAMDCKCSKHISAFSNLSSNAKSAFWRERGPRRKPCRVSTSICFATKTSSKSYQRITD